MIIINYTKLQYQEKINALNSSKGRLENHLGLMRDLRTQLPKFWNDPNAQQTGKVLDLMIDATQGAHTRTNDLLSFYQNAVDDLDASGNFGSEAIQDALSLLAGLGGL